MDGRMIGEEWWNNVGSAIFLFYFILISKREGYE